MTANPLTHHQIIELIDPFVCAGRELDLAASDRSARRLVFKALEISDGNLPGGLRELLTLESPDADRYRLVRSVTAASGLTATLTAEGTDPAGLLDRVLSFAPAAHFRVAAGILIAFNYRFAPTIADTAPGGARGDLVAVAPDQVGEAPRPHEDDRSAEADGNAGAGSTEGRLVPPVLTDAQAVIGGVLRLTLDAETTRPRRVWLELRPEPAVRLRLPPDLLAVLGRSWHYLQRYYAEAWRTTIVVARQEPARSQDIVAKVTQTVAHLAAVLSESPSAYHERFGVVRRQVFVRGLVAILLQFGIVVAGPILLASGVSEESVFFMLAYFWPVLLLLALPLFADRLILMPPGWPRRLPADAWSPFASATAPPAA
ncbi:hypothetical protein ABC977_16795 [Thioalkalicoccus limnaeus]|uniref:Uncharacterized protein n=1 Tax=Thioalkalicoccus limnaeus TaxID=120681 RepID=A0ABV4BNK3_9GAMM